MFMKKTSLYLDPSVDLSLTRLAASQGITKAELIRRTLAKAASETPPARISAIGIGAGPGDVADDTDRHLRESGFGKA